MSSYIELTISKIREEAEGIKSFYFEGPDARKISYKAGQYLTFVLPAEFGEIRRSYSITSAPQSGEPLSVAVKRIENGLFSRYLVNEAREGDKLLTTGAGGFFTLPENNDSFNQLFFFAAGSGITPVLSLVKAALFGIKNCRVVLIYSNRDPVSALFLKELQALEKQYAGRFTVEYLYSTSSNLYRARLHKDFLKSLVKEHASGPLEEGLYYLCGPENYMVMCTYGLGQLEVPLSRIRKEIFTTAKVLPKLTPPDTEPHMVTIEAGALEHRFKVQYPETIHRAARNNGIALPYSCETGRCGNCAARCTQGKVWMSYNEVLTEKDLEEGMVLTCVGYPINGDVKLKIL